jgi:hypothetical protein
MSENKGTKQAITSFFSGFSTGTALRLWFFFLFCFFFLRYTIPFSILLGAIGGFAAGWVLGWWKTKDDPTTLKSSTLQESEVVDDRPSKASGLRLAKQHRDARRKGSSRSLTPFSGFFQRGKSKK